MTLVGQVPRRDQIPRGILFMVGSTVLFAGVNAIVKWEVATYPVGEEIVRQDISYHTVWHKFSSRHRGFLGQVVRGVELADPPHHVGYDCLHVS